MPMGSYKVVRRGGLWYVVNTDTKKAMGRGYATSMLASRKIASLKSQQRVINNPEEGSTGAGGGGAVLTDKDMPKHTMTDVMTPKKKDAVKPE